MNTQQLTSAFGAVLILTGAWLLSTHKRSINWRTVLWGTALQFIFALLILKTPPGRWVFSLANSAVLRLLSFQEEGAKFVFGNLALAPGKEGSLGFYFAFQVLTTIVFLSSLMSALYYLGVMQKVVLFFGKIMQPTCRTSGAETLCASANIFVGQTEAPLVIRPYLAEMTESELFCVMVGGMATIAAGVMVAYVSMLQPYLPNVAGHLLAAGVMSAPAALVIAKLMIPETGKPKTLDTLKLDYKDSNSSVIEAAASGASTGMQLALNVGAMLVAFMSLLAMVNWGLHRFFGAFQHPEIGLEQLFGWALSPVAWIMGVPWKECSIVGMLIGEKTVLNEFVAYLHMSQYAAAHSAQPLSYRSSIIAVYALCGFSNILSIAIQIGGIGALVPERRKDLARLGVKALLAGSLACFLTAAIVGILIP
ncbi:MAG: nucleoside transporter C-terminal domain-containing protein [Elusimicrobiota bacterium]|jgi:CNT family concentrative nucleoside transporter